MDLLTAEVANAVTHSNLKLVPNMKGEPNSIRDIYVELKEEFEELFATIEASDTYAHFTPRNVTVLIAAFLVLFIELMLVRKLPEKRTTRKLKIAKARGHVITATRLKYYLDGEKTDSLAKYSAEYSYIVDGKRYRYGYYDPHFPPETITLYYKNNPKKCFRDNKSWGFLGLLIWLIPIAMCVLLIQY